MTTYKTIGNVCAGRWPRLLTLQLAAAYLCESSIARFRKEKKFRELVFIENDREVVDRYRLDALIDEEAGSQTIKN
jgi:hypothetical protein